MLGDGGLARVLWRGVGMRGRVFRGDAVLRGGELGRSVRLSHCVRGSCRFLITLKNHKSGENTVSVAEQNLPPGPGISYPDALEVPARCPKPSASSSSSPDPPKKEEPSFREPHCTDGRPQSSARAIPFCTEVISPTAKGCEGLCSTGLDFSGRNPYFIPIWRHVSLYLSPVTAEP